MTEPTTALEPRRECGWLKAYHPSGLLVTLPVPFDGDYTKAFAAVDAALAAGFTANLPGLEAGEEKQDVGYVARTLKNGRSGPAHMLWLYSPRDEMTFKFLTTYLNTPEDVEVFEKVSGLRLAAIPEFPGEAAPQRGKSPASDKMIVKAPRPFGVVYHDNPKYNEAEAAAATPTAPYTVPKRKFLRWADAPKPTEKQDNPAAPDLNEELRQIEAAIALDPTADGLTELLRRAEVSFPKGSDYLKTAHEKIKAFQEAARLQFNRGTYSFYLPVEKTSGIPF